MSVRPADWLEAKLSHVKADTHLLEKLLTGDWDEQFLIVSPDETIEKEKVLSFS